jgi:hypothetical protein
MRLLLPLILLACSGPSTTPVETGDGDADTDTDADSDADTDTDTDTDEDGDGWSVEEGDCDDGDIWVNPAWDEDTSDDKDNDCDGRIDETFAGVLVIDADASGAENTTLQLIDIVGDLVSSTVTTAKFYPEWIDDEVDLRSWVAWDRYTLGLYHFDATGDVQRYVDLSEYDWGEDGPAWLTGVAAHPDGYYLVAGSDRLLKMHKDGTWEEAVRTTCDLMTPEVELCPTAIATDRRTGRTAVFGKYGGYGIWTEEGGIEVKLPANIDPWSSTFMDAKYREGGGLFALGANVEGEGDAAQLFYGIYKYNEPDDVIVRRNDWPNNDFVPTGFASEGETGAWYIAANGGWCTMAWRTTPDFDYTGLLWPDAASVTVGCDGSTGGVSIDPDRMFLGTTVLWNHE